MVSIDLDPVSTRTPAAAVGIDCDVRRFGDLFETAQLTVVGKDPLWAVAGLPECLFQGSKESQRVYPRYSGPKHQGRSGVLPATTSNRRSAFNGCIRSQRRRGAITFCFVIGGPQHPGCYCIARTEGLSHAGRLLGG